MNISAENNCDRTNSLFGNNSGKSGPIGTKFYREMYGQMALWRPSLNVRNMAPKNFCKLFVTKTTHRFTQFPAADFHEI